ncbi:hypothetical protein EJ04DRAFT_588586 [Polyplosphaeria fusca]|uniref:Uncharacterized protein n=1 Tax=Polyplosphaeria fusca TaxID=682080 RepID=A0A9P4QRF5_9PLEO|nr:hypothetical protein EJ04DRAFT_588586 [Polyplosphaeria fusca]
MRPFPTPKRRNSSDLAFHRPSSPRAIIARVGLTNVTPKRSSFPTRKQPSRHFKANTHPLPLSPSRTKPQTSTHHAHLRDSPRSRPHSTHLLRPPIHRLPTLPNPPPLHPHHIHQPHRNHKCLPNLPLASPLPPPTPQLPTPPNPPLLLQLHHDDLPLRPLLLPPLQTRARRRRHPYPRLLPANPLPRHTLHRLQRPPRVLLHRVWEARV